MSTDESEKLVPETADEYARYIENGSSRIRGMNELQSRNPVENYYEQITPIDPVTPSTNWATEPPRKGFDMSDMNTYQIRDTDRLQAALFDRFILRDKAQLFTEKDKSLGRLIDARLGPPINSFQDIKRYARGGVRGPAHTSVRQMEEDRVNY